MVCKMWNVSNKVNQSDKQMNLRDSEISTVTREVVAGGDPVRWQKGQQVRLVSQVKERYILVSEFSGNH